MIIAGKIQAQSIAGTWYGLLNIPSGQVHIVYHITQNADAYSATMDSPDQGAKGIPMDNVSFSGNKITIGSGKIGISYTGIFLPDSNKIKGTFNQGAFSAPLDLSSVMKKAVILNPRPQDPKDFPYKQEDVKFTNAKDGDVLAGTLTMPADGRAKRLVILITGSGPQNRNEELAPFNHRPFLVWSDWLTRQGIAVLRFDDRGIAESTGDFKAATTADFADDAEAAVNYVLSRPDLQKLDIGLLGHSEGGMIAPIVASRDKNVKFIVLLAGPGVPISELMTQQEADQMRLGGAPDTAIAFSTKTNRTLFAAMNQYYDLPADKMKIMMDSVMFKEFSAYPKQALAGKTVDDLVKESSTQIASPWFRYFIHFKPADYLINVKCPVLALDGTVDSQVKCEPNLQGIKQALDKGGNKHYEVVPMPGLNHLFQKATTGAVSEYGTITETVDPTALEKVSSWINGL